MPAGMAYPGNHRKDLGDVGFGFGFVQVVA
jgi:hypothetical protein